MSETDAGASLPPLPPDYTGPPGYAVLPAGTRVERYVIERALAAGGFGVTYLARHETLGLHVVLKEHFPRQMASREHGTNAVRAHDPAMFQWARDRFLEEARALVRCKHPNIVEAIDVLEANGTAYMVLSYEEGVSLERWLTRLERVPTQAELDAILGPLLDALAFVHGQGILHRDIAPDNIMIRSDGKPCLIDFGAARQAIGLLSGSVTAIVKPGYSPVEQYVSEAADQDAWTDIYAMGATLYRAVTGKRPMEATARIPRDRMQPATGAARAPTSWRPGFLAAIDAALAIDHLERPASVAAWRGMLLGAGDVATRAGPAPHPAGRETFPNPPPFAGSGPEAMGARSKEGAGSGADAGGYPKRQEERADAGGHLKRQEGRADAGGHLKRQEERADAGGHLKRQEGTAAAPSQSESRRGGGLKAAAAVLLLAGLAGGGWWVMQQRAASPAAEQRESIHRTPSAPGTKSTTENWAVRQQEEQARRATETEANRVAAERAEAERRIREATDARVSTVVARLEAEAKERRLREEKADAEEKARQEAAELARKQKPAEDARRRDPVAAQQPVAPAATRVAIPKGLFFRGQVAGEQLAKDRLISQKVYNREGRIVAAIEDLIINRDNQVVGVIIGTGGSHGAGEKELGVRLSALQVGRDSKITLPALTKEVVAALEPYKRAEPRRRNPVADREPAVQAATRVAIPKGVFLRGQVAGEQLAKDRLISQKVYNREGRIVATIEDLIIDRENQIVGVIIGTGGFLGAGEKKIGVRLSALQVARDNRITLPALTKEVVAALEPYKRAEPRRRLIDRDKEAVQPK